MAAPSSTVWGSIVGGYGRIGIYTSLSSTATTTSVSVQIWFWSKYSVLDGANNLYYDLLNAAGSATTRIGSMSIDTTVASGDGWSTSNQMLLKSYSYSYTRVAKAITKYPYAKLADVDRVGGTMYASSSFTIPALATYTISFNANGGSGAPSSRTKSYGITIILPETVPTRTGYTFQGWATSSTGGVAYAAGASYTANADATLYAVWKANTYTVSYNANGGTNAPSSQTKSHGTALTLSSEVPTRTNYKFLGWGTSASATTVAYAAGASYSNNNSITLYAVWELDYIAPIIVNLTVARCNSSGVETSEGTYCLVKFDWECSRNVSTITVGWSSASGGSGSATITASGMSGSISQAIGGGALSLESTWDMVVQVSDVTGTRTESKTTLYGSMFPIDALAGGKGVAFGKPAEIEGVADFAYEAKFNEPVYGKALGMDRLPAIPEESDFNNYLEPGCYAVYSNAIAGTCYNFPGDIDRAGRLEVWSATGEGVRLEQWSYLRQRFVPYNSANAVWERDITRSSDNVWTYGEWWKSTLTPAVSEKVYAKAAATIALGSNTVLGVVNTYTQIPLNQSVIFTSNRLIRSNNAIRIGENIQYVKVSGQVLIKCGSTTGNRHVRIQKVSADGSITSVAWVCVYGVAASNTLYSLTPIWVSVEEGDSIRMVFYTSDSADSIASGSAANGWQTYLTVEEH